MDPALEFAAFQHNPEIQYHPGVQAPAETHQSSPSQETAVSMSEGSRARRTPWWRREIFWVLVVGACMIVLIAVAAFRLRPSLSQFHFLNVTTTTLTGTTTTTSSKASVTTASSTAATTITSTAATVSNFTANDSLVLF
ncbi:uncharacterized protein LOC144094547 [Amblyomma americanum]